MRAEQIIQHLKMQKHPEGGAFVETYRSSLSAEFISFTGKRSSSTGIYFLLQQGEISAFHRIKSDEMWHFYHGDPLEVVEITPEGKIIRTTLGRDLISGESFQYTVKAGHWFASHSLGDFSLVGCTVAPGFDFQDFELAERGSLANAFPEHQELITKFTY